MPKTTDDMVGYVLGGDDRHRVLHVLMKRELRPIEMSGEAGIELTRVSRALKEMGEFKLVERANELRGRGAMWRITAAGKTVADRVFAHTYPHAPMKRPWATGKRPRRPASGSDRPLGTV